MGERLYGPVCIAGDILRLNDERYRKGLVLSFTGAQESRRKLPLRTEWLFGREKKIYRGLCA